MNWITCPHCKISFDMDHPDNRGEYEEIDGGALVECVTLRKVFQDRIRQARRAATRTDRFWAGRKEPKPCIR